MSSEPASSGGSGGGFPGGKLAWLGLGTVLAGSGGAAAIARARLNRTDPTPDFASACSALCSAKADEAQANADVSAAQTGLDQAQQAWTNAQNYLATQLRNDYLSSKYLHRGGYAMASVLGGPFLWAAEAGDMFGTMSDSPRFLVPTGAMSSAYWNQEVNDALPGAQAQIDQIGGAAVAAWMGKLADARRRQSNAVDAGQSAKQALAALRAGHPDVTFPDCNCE